MTYSFLTGRYLMSAHPRFSLRRVSGVLSVRVHLCSLTISFMLEKVKLMFEKALRHGLVP
jgi:hypothetical protein